MSAQTILMPIAAALSSAVLLGLSFMAPSPVVPAFVAIVPLLWICQQQPFAKSIALVFVANILALQIADFSSWQRPNVLVYLLIQSILLSLPWVLYQVIKTRHNQKLGYVVLVSSWLTLEWATGQLWGQWQGLQLGMAPLTLSSLVQWYEYLGVTAGSLWLLSVNIHIYRTIWPAQAHTRRAAIINGLLVLILPILGSLLMAAIPHPAANFHEESFALASAPSAKPGTVTKPLILGSADLAYLEDQRAFHSQVPLLAASAKHHEGILYQAAADTLASAFVAEASEHPKTVVASTIKINDISGISQRKMYLSQWADTKVAMLNAHSFLRSELPRLHAKQEADLLIGFADSSDYYHPVRMRQFAVLRAIENRTNVILFLADGKICGAHPSGHSYIPNGYKEPNIFAIRATYNSFFRNYGDLIGRLSIFVSVWLCLGTIVKPFRKK